MPDKTDFWDNIESSYPAYPTVRHRKRFVRWAAKKYIKAGPDSFIFDYGCGPGDILRAVGSLLDLSDTQLGGSDMSARSIEISKNKIKSPHFFNELFPNLPQPCDAIICSEVIEHAKEYKRILSWIFNNLNRGGVFILSTQGGQMHKIDEYSGHVQTFKIDRLCQELKQLGFEILYQRKWGWPLFSLQKYLTDFKFDKIKSAYLEGEPNILNKILFNIVYRAYLVHDCINKGPQLYIVAKK